MIKLLARDRTEPVICFMVWVREQDQHVSGEGSIKVIATDVWDLNSMRTDWMDDASLPGGFCHQPDIDVFDDANVWEFDTSPEGQKRAHKKMCEIYAWDYQRLHVNDNKLVKANKE